MRFNAHTSLILTAMRFAPLLLCASRPAWPGLCCMGSDGANARYGQPQLERNSVEWMYVHERTAADALRHGRAGLVEHGVVWRHDSITSQYSSERSRTPPPAMCEREEKAIPPRQSLLGEVIPQEVIPPVKGPPGDLEETALELEQVSDLALTLTLTQP